MIESIEQVVAELKNKRISKAAAIELIRDFSVRSRKATGEAKPTELKNEDRSDLRTLRYSRRLSGEEFFLSDHRVQLGGEMARVLPAVMYLEMVRAGVEGAWPGEKGKILELRNTVWEQPARVESMGKEIHLGLSEGEKEIEYEIYSEEDGERVVHCRGRAGWSEEETARVDVEQVKNEMAAADEVDPERIYGRCVKSGLMHGPALQGLRAVRRGSQQVLAEVSLPEMVQKTWGDYVLHPSLLDSALQAAVALTEERADEEAEETQLPFALEKLRILGRCPREAWVWVRYRGRSEAGKNNKGQQVDVDVCDARGNVSVSMQGFSTRAVKRGERSEGRGEERGRGSVLERFVSVWNAVEPERRSKSGIGGKVLFLGGEGRQLEWVRRSYPSAYAWGLGVGASVAEMQLRFQECEFDQLLWMAPDVEMGEGEGGFEGELIGEQEWGVVAVFRMMKALLGLGYWEKELSWTLITCKTERVKQDEAVKPVHAGVMGFVGSAAKEYGQWEFNLLDVEKLGALTAAECLSLKGRRGGEGLAHRQGEWYAREYARVERLQSGGGVRYRQGGVYVVIGGAGGLGEVWTRYMMERYQARVVWIGRRKREDAWVEARLGGLAGCGEEPWYISADASRLGELAEAGRLIAERYGEIHGVLQSAIVLRDQSLMRMEEGDLRASLSAKVDVSVNMDRVFGGLGLDFMLFFSSIVAFVKPAGQSNYAAGSTFEDSFAESLRRVRGYAVKVMNWGYWGSVGVVAEESYSRSMARQGVGSLEAEEGMSSLESLMESALEQMAVAKTIGGVEKLVHFSEELRVEGGGARPGWPDEVQQTQIEERSKESRKRLEQEGEQSTEMEGMLAEMLTASLKSVGLLGEGFCRLADLRRGKRGAGFYEKWLNVSLSYLQEQKWVGEDLQEQQEVRACEEIWREWEERKAGWGSEGQVRIVEECLRGLPGILRGEQMATEVMFPSASLELVEAIYGGNAQADYFHEVLTETLAGYLEQELGREPGRRFRILEIGAGTGSTTAKLQSVWAKFPLEEYCYTDISKAFLQRGEEEYGGRLAGFRTAFFDISQPLAGQGIVAGYYDAVVASNVVHATPRIQETLRNVKAALKPQGIVVLNEISSWSLLTHLTFGLLEGWWLAADRGVRLAGSPGLAAESWQRVLEEEGFEGIFFSAAEARRYGQQIIVGRSDGRVRQRRTVISELSVSPWLGRVSCMPAALPESEKQSDQGDEDLREKAIAYFRKLVSASLKLRAEQIALRRPLTEYGLDSILVGQLTYQLRKQFSDITATLFFEVQNLEGLVDHFVENRKAELVRVLGTSQSSRSRALPPVARVESHWAERAGSATEGGVETKKEKSAELAGGERRGGEAAGVLDVAIVGLSGRYPGARKLKQFWTMLAGGVNCISEIPAQRWSWEQYYDGEKGKEGKIYTRWGGFIEGVEEFDPLFFRISPKEARRMDPQERLILQGSYEAMEDAGYRAEELGKAEKVGVFVGVMNGRYTPQPNHASIANRVSYVFNFQGPSLAVDTACSASLTAMHMALESLYRGESECALVGGVNVILDAAHYLQLTEMTMLSAGRECRAFGEEADGFVDGEGVGVAVLKPLEQAEKDGDHIYGVIKGSAINAGGRTHGYTVPNLKAQARVVVEALQRAGVRAGDVSYIEAHGTGTALGDPIEIAGLTRAFAAGSAAKQYCAIGSVKSNIGHCESAAGMAGLTKVLLQMQHGQLVPSLHAERANPEIEFEQTPFKVQQHLEAWERPVVDGREHSRVAGISSFGAGGSNAHVIVEEYVGQTRERSGEWGEVVIVLSARTAEQLEEKVRELLEWMGEEQGAGGREIDVESMAYTLQVGREGMGERVGLVVKTVGELEKKLAGLLSGQEMEGVYRGEGKRNNEDGLRLFSSDEDMQEAVGKWMEKGKYGKLLELWVKGVEVDWGRMYGERKPGRLSLPTYPFARERYWIEGVGSGKVELGGLRETVLHPLVQRNTSDLSEQRYSTTLTGEEFFLRDHELANEGQQQQKVLPAAAYLEMARAGIEQACAERREGAELELRDVMWAEPLVVQESLEVRIALQREEANGIGFEIYSVTGGEEKVHCQGRGEWSRSGGVEKLDVEQLQWQMVEGDIEPGQIYASLRGMGVVHGPSMQVLKRVQRGSKQVLAELSLPIVVSRTSGEYVLHPSLLDGALQASVGLMEGERADSGAIGLPYALEAIRIRSSCREAMWAWVRYAEGSQQGDAVVKVDIDLCDEQGQVCVQMRGVSSRRANRAASIGKPSGKAEYLLATPEWRAKEADTSPIEYVEQHIILCDVLPSTAEKLQHLLPHKHWIYLTVGTAKNIAERYNEYALACFEQIQAILRKLAGKTLVQILIVVDDGQSILAGLSGLLNTASLENPQLVGQVILLSRDESVENVMRYLAQESAVTDVLVRYGVDGRQVRSWREVERQPQGPAPVFRNEGVYLITGGMNGLGLVFAREILAKTEHTRVVLTGRSALNTDRQWLLRKLSGGSDRVSYRELDLLDLYEVKRLIASVKAELGQLSGILHCAGMVSDSFILKKTKAEFLKVLAPKVTGTFHLDQACQQEALHCFVLFSSMAVMGSVGQADYAASNGFMDQFAAYRNMQVALGERHGHTRSINWGAWAEGGMKLDPARQAFLNQNAGLQALPTCSGLEAFHRSLVLPYAQILAAGGNVAKLLRALPGGEQSSHFQPGNHPEAPPAIANRAAPAAMQQKTEEYLRTKFSELLQLPAHRIDPQAPLENYGIDSVLAMKLTNQMEQTFGPLSKTLFFEYQTIACIARHLVKTYPAVVLQAVAPVVEKTKPEDLRRAIVAPSQLESGRRVRNRFSGFKRTAPREIAIIGVAGRYPQAENLQQFWTNLKNGRDCITEIPPERWDKSRYYHPDGNQTGKTYSKWGGFIADVDRFDPLFFNVSPKDAELIDPQERLFLEVAWETIEDAGYRKERISGSRTGVFVGVMWGHYQLFGAESIGRARAATTSSYSSIANRVSYFFDFHGPSIALDTMCSSSLTAMHLACEELRRGEINTAIAGGVNLTIHPYKYVSLSQGRFIASDGRCRSFGMGGDGYVPGEGVGAVLLKTLENAERDGDQIYAVIRSSSIGHGGKTNGYTVPNPNAQADLVRSALEKANINPATLGYIETHGTGTSLGDPIEIAGLLKAIEPFTEQKQFIPIGSVKSNIGHLESAAGIAAVTKAILQIRHKKLVPSLHADTLNPNINFKDSPFYVHAELSDWVCPGSYPRRIGVSSFGAGGSNAHLILEEHWETGNAKKPANLLSSEIFVLSARDKDALLRYTKKIRDFLADTPDLCFKDLVYTSQVGRTPMQARLAVVSSSMEDLAGKLNLWIGLQETGCKGPSSALVELKDTFEGITMDWQHSEAGLISGPAGRAFLQEVAVNGDLGKIARLWILGADVDWSVLHREITPRRVSIPTYPFAKEKCWVTRELLPSVDSQRSTGPTVESVERSDRKQRAYYLPKWIRKDFAASPLKTWASNGPMLILDTSDDLFSRIQHELENELPSDSIVLLRAGSALREIQPNCFTLDFEREDHLEEFVEQLRSRNLLPGLVLHHCSEPCGLEGDAQVDQQLKSGIYPLFSLCKALIKQKEQKPARILSVFAPGTGTVAPFAAAMAAFCQTLALEYPRFLTKSVDLSRMGQDEKPLGSSEARVLWNEFCDQDWTAHEVRYHAESREGGKRFERHARMLERCTLPDKGDSELPLRQKGVYLIAGGLGGLGLIFAEYLAKNFQARLVLVGRSAPQANQEQKLRKIGSYGAEILVIQADVSRREEAEDVVRQARARFSSINGVIHCAGATRDAFILKKSNEQMRTVLEPKLYGSIHLDLATQFENLDLFVLFSSIAGVMGNIGQSDYAYANHFLDGFAEHRQNLKLAGKRSGRTLSINWPLWEQGGMLVSQEEVALIEDRTGISPLPTAEGLQCWEDILRSKASQCLAVYGDTAHIASFIDQKLLKHPVNSTEQEKRDARELLADTERYLKTVVGQEIKLDPDRIGSSERLESFGIDSLAINRINLILEKDLGALPKTLLYQYETVEDVARFLSREIPQGLTALLGSRGSQAEALEGANAREVAEVAASSSAGKVSSEPIAIVGIHGRYPHSPDLAAYWESLKQGRDLTDLVPESRWSWEEFYDPDPRAAANGKIYCKQGGFLDDHDKFDPDFFHISREDARLMDPQERLFLESAWAAIEDAGYTRDSLKRLSSDGKSASVGVFAGVTTNSYHMLGLEERDQGNFVSPSAMPWSIANRVSYFFNFNGPSMPVDTACSSSLVAIHLACESLRNGECQVAIAGGVNLYLHPYKYQALCCSRMLSVSGKCQSYGEGADGFVPGEGVGTVVLKPLSKALEHEDHIHGIIAASGFDHGGRSNGYSAPNPNAQATLISKTLHKANIHPETISYVEGHGTGTQLGDSLEVAALSQAFRELTVKQQFCPIGSVKANIGHAESASGMASLTKILLQLKHGQLSPSVHSAQANPDIEFEKSPVYLQRGLTAWKPSPFQPRRALINSFGAGGVNACMVVEEYEKGTANGEATPDQCLFVLSAKNDDRLREYVHRFLAYLRREPSIDLASICYTLQTGREAMETRLAFTISNLKELMSLIERWSSGICLPGVFQSTSRPHRGAKPAVRSESIAPGEQALSRIASNWVAGEEVDWYGLYPGKRPGRVALPTYPFARERYWVSDSALRARRETPSIGQLHPLVSQNCSTLREISFASFLSNTGFYAVDHQINGAGVFPAAAFLEMACISGNITVEERIRVIRDVVWARPLMFPTGSTELRTCLKPKKDAVEFAISSLNDESESVLYCEGRLAYGTAVALRPIVERMPIELLKQQCAIREEGAGYYAKFRHFGIAYGPSFQPIQEIYTHASFALSKLKLPEHLKADFDEFLLHPSIIDGALQTVAALAAAPGAAVSHLPFSLDELEMLHPLRQVCYVYAVVAEPHEEKPDSRKFDICVMNESGDVLVNFKGLYLRALNKLATDSQSPIETMVNA